MTSSRNTGQSSRIGIVLAAFVLICAAILVGSLAASARAGTTGTGEATSFGTCPEFPTDDARWALQEATQADLALREENFGAAQVHIQRARVRLEGVVSQLEQDSSP